VAGVRGGCSRDFGRENRVFEKEMLPDFILVLFEKKGNRSDIVMGKQIDSITLLAEKDVFKVKIK
jgi:hypothetical protein